MVERTIPVPFKCPPKMAKSLEQMVDAGIYTSVGEAIRDGVRCIQKRTGFYGD